MNGTTRESRMQLPRAPKQSGIEWIGGCLESPFLLTDRPEPYRPMLAVWIEAPEGIVVGHELLMPEETTGALGRTLRAAMDFFLLFYYTDVARWWARRSASRSHRHPSSTICLRP